MAFITDKAVAVPGNNTNGRNDNWKSEAFLNLYLPAKDGSRRKIGFVALKGGRAVDRQLIDYLKADPEANVAALLDKLELEFNLANKGEDNALDL